MSQSHEPYDRSYIDTGDPTFEPNTLVIADQSLRLGFVQLPKVILYARNISRDAKLLYAVLLGYAWQEQRCFPGYGRLCQDMGASENAVRKYMRELETVGLLSQRRRGLGKTNLYILTDLRTAKIEVQEHHASRTAKIEVQESPDSAAPEPAKSAGKVETERIDSEEKETAFISNAAHEDSLHKIDLLLNGKSEKTKLPKYVENSGRALRPDVRGTRSATGGGFQPVSELLPAPPALRTGPARTKNMAVRGRPPQVSERVAALIEELTYRLHDDPDNIRSNITRAARLGKASGLSDEAFYHRLHEAKSITQQQGNVKKDAGDGHGVINRMPYFFAVVEDLIGLKDRRVD